MFILFIDRNDFWYLIAFNIRYFKGALTLGNLYRSQSRLTPKSHGWKRGASTHGHVCTRGHHAQAQLGPAGGLGRRDNHAFRSVWNN